MRGPKGEKRPADVIGMSVMVAKIATGELKRTGTNNRTGSKADVLEEEHVRRN